MLLDEEVPRQACALLGHLCRLLHDLHRLAIEGYGLREPLLVPVAKLLALVQLAHAGGVLVRAVLRRHGIRLNAEKHIFFPYADTRAGIPTKARRQRPADMIA